MLVVLLSRVARHEAMLNADLSRFLPTLLASLDCHELRCAQTPAAVLCVEL
jgi:hypothetical protein